MDAATIAVSKEVLQSKTITYTDVANKLIKDKLLLTALELHTELLESGKEVKQLKDFFSNPGNFECQYQDVSSKISRSGSQTTLDSLDLTRYSEDGERSTDEKIAVLEFELRKARETISALRNNLTVATESENKTLDKASLRMMNNDIKPHEERALNFLINEYLLLRGYKLTSITFADENECQDFEDWDDVGLNIAKPVELLTLYRRGLKQTGCNLISACSQTENVMKAEEKISAENESLRRKVASLNEELSHFKHCESSQKQGSKTSTIGSDSPERFELIEKTSGECDNVSNTSITMEWTRINKSDEETAGKKQESFIFVSKTQSQHNDIKYRNALLKLCPITVPESIEREVLQHALNQSNTHESLVQVVSDTLLRIIPNIILNKREEVIPLLVSAINMNTIASTRDKLLQQLFNLKKKPLNAERTLILAGILGVVKQYPESVIENEILPLCWEQLAHKHVERRLLVVESCRLLIPYVSPPIRNSLMLSMLQQMLEDKDETVRQEVVKVLTLLIAFCHDTDKYSQCEQLAFVALDDDDENIVKLTVALLFPIVAKWSLDIGRLQSSLIKNLLQKINDMLKNMKQDSPSRPTAYPEVILRVISVLNTLLPYLLMNVAFNQAVLNRIEKREMTIDLRPELLNICSELTNPNNFFATSSPAVNVGMVLYEFDKLFEENCDHTWFELEWLSDTVFPDLLNSLNLIEITQHDILQSFINLFANICVVFGRNFTLRKIRPLLQTHVQSLEAILSSFNQYSPSLNIIPVHLVSVLSYCDTDEAAYMLSQFLCSLPLFGIPLDCLEITVRGMCSLNLQQLVLTSLWDGVVHQKPLVRAVTAGLFAAVIAVCSDMLLNVKVAPALVTLANDSDILVRTATVPALGSLITDCSSLEMHDKAYMQLQMFLADAATAENHSLLRQLVVTMGTIVSSCTASFRQDVILPHLASVCNQMAQMTSQTHKVDMAVALIDAYSNIICSQFHNHIVSGQLLLPGLRCLEQAINENAMLHAHKDALNSMVKECEARIDFGVSKNAEKNTSSSASKITQNVNQGVEEMKQRMSKMFNKPQTTTKQNLQSLQGFFKKK